MEQADEEKTISEIASEGGHARAEKLSKEKKSEIARIAANARWERDGSTRILRSTHEGILHIGPAAIQCAVLENGQRVLTQSSFMRALGRARQAKGRSFYNADVNMPAFLTAKNLKAYVSKDLDKTSSQIEFRTKRGAKAFGYPAELLPKVCDVFLDAKEADKLLPNQEHIAQRAKILMRGLAHVGIIALVDEATNFQEIRDRVALQAILDRFLRKELAAWAKRFPDEFYEQIFRLRKWVWKGMSVNRPQVVATYTKDIVYARLAPKILKELEALNPRDERGYRKAKHHQWLTEDVGHPALAQHLYAVIGFMRVNDTWDGFMRMLNKAFPKRGDTLDLPFMSEGPGTP